MRNKSTRIKRFIYGVIAILVLIVVAGFIFLKLNTYAPQEDASAMLDLPHVTDHADWIKISQNQPVARVVFYPGGLVEPSSYLPLFEPLSDEGLEIFIAKMPLNLAILNTNAIETIQEEEPTQLPTFLSGHSLGGASAALYLEEHPQSIDGLLLLAAYPAESSDLSQVDFPVLSITASEDAILDWETFEESKTQLPDDTQYEMIDGGNHANFGSYGKQDGDGENTISRRKQHELTQKLFIDLIDLNEKPDTSDDVEKEE